MRSHPALAVVALLIVVLVPVLAQAQNATPASGLPLPSIGLPLPEIGLPHPAMGLPPVESAKPAEPSADDRGRQGVRRDDGDRGRDRRGRTAPPVVMFPLYVVPPSATPAVSGTSVGAAKPAAGDGTGRLVLDVTPAASAQLYVDGYYVGTPADYPEGIELNAGPHALEVRAPGAETVATSLQIGSGRSITYRAALVTGAASERAAGDTHATASPSQPAAAPTSAPATRGPFYMIPGCYLGNVPPDADNVPEGCDISRVRTVAP